MGQFERFRVEKNARLGAVVVQVASVEYGRIFQRAHGPPEQALLARGGRGPRREHVVQVQRQWPERTLAVGAWTR